MPELPEVETIRRAMERSLLHKRFHEIEVRRADLRQAVPPAFKETLEGRRCTALTRRGKYIMCMLEGGAGFALHLGMSGRISILSPGSAYQPARHDHIIFKMHEGTVAAFNDPRRFGMVFMVDAKDWRRQKPFAAMGPEPLEDDFSGPALLKALKNRKGPVKTALLDQSVVSGVGNIYASEALYHAGIPPGLPGRNLTKGQANKLAAAIRQVLERALEAGGSTLKDYRQADGSSGYFQHRFSVYDREGRACPACRCDIAVTGGIVKTAQSGRSTFHCPRMQK